MSVVSELIRSEADGTISFGDYSLGAKAKLDNFEHQGNIYKVKTYKDITKLEKNGKMLFESVPGATVHNFTMNERNIEFNVESTEDVQITMELEPEQEYKLIVDDMLVGKMESNIAGKINFSVELGKNTADVKIEKI